MPSPAAWVYPRLTWRGCLGRTPGRKWRLLHSRSDGSHPVFPAKRRGLSPAFSTLKSVRGQGIWSATTYPGWRRATVGAGYFVVQELHDVRSADAQPRIDDDPDVGLPVGALIDTLRKSAVGRYPVDAGKLRMQFQARAGSLGRVGEVCPTDHRPVVVGVE